MDITMRTPDVADLDRIRDTLAAWQDDAAPLHIHPGDLGWHSIRGPSATASAIRVWDRDEDVLAIGFLDEATVFRLAIAPDMRDQEHLAELMAQDLDTPGHGILPDGEVAVEARGAHLLAHVLGEREWEPGERWTPLRLDLSGGVPSPDIRIEDVDEDLLPAWARVHRSAFRDTRLEGEEFAAYVDRLRTMLFGPFARGGRVRLIAGFADGPEPVAVACVWSAGPGRPGLLEPMGVHREQRRHGYGRAITRAAAEALADLEASSMIVCTETDRPGASLTYESAGLVADEPVADLTRRART